MSYTIQQIEQLDFNEFKDKPEELITLAKQLMGIKKYESAISMLEKAINLAGEKYGEDKLECAKFYYSYADALVRKLSEGEELFGTAGESDKAEVADDKPQKDHEDDIKVENVDQNIPKTNGHNDYNNIEEEPKDEVSEDDAEEHEEEEEHEQAEAITDEQYAFENIAFAEKIYKGHLSQYDDKPVSELSDEVKKIYIDYADIFHKYGELEMCKSDFKAAAQYFQKALDIRNKYQSKFSRAIAELYWNMASVYDFDSKKCLLCYYKTKVILEYHLKQELSSDGYPTQADKIIVNEGDLDLETIELDKIVYFKDVIESLGENINDEIAELVDLLGIIYIKVRITHYF
jgi:hypothetical protein